MTATMHERTVLPPAEPKELQLLLQSMAERAADGGTATLVSPDGVTAWKLPDEIYRVLRDVMEAMSQGLAITVAPQHTMLTTQEAADLLGISRPTLVKLLEEGKIAYSKHGRHRRVALRDTLDYQESARIERRARLSEMVASAEEDGLYEATSTPKPTR